MTLGPAPRPASFPPHPPATSRMVDSRTHHTCTALAPRLHCSLGLEFCLLSGGPLLAFQNLAQQPQLLSSRSFLASPSSPSSGAQSLHVSQYLALRHTLPAHLRPRLTRRRAPVTTESGLRAHPREPRLRMEAGEEPGSLELPGNRQRQARVALRAGGGECHGGSCRMMKAP